MTSSGRAIPIVYQGQQFPNRTALADHLAPLVGKTRSTLITLLSRYDGDVERVVAPLSHRRPITFEEQASRIGRRWRNISLPACIGRSDRSRDC
jgi:hypothetical protein